MMKSSLFGPLILLLQSSIVVFGLGSVVNVFYIHFKFPLTWEQAQSYCKREFIDLATINVWSDISNLNLKEYYSWIGLHKNTSLSWDKWVWSDGRNYDIDYWQDDAENAHGDCAFVIYKNKRVFVRACEHRLFFICRSSAYNYYHYQFIPEAKTWLEAQQYCRKNYYDLAGFSSGYFNNVLIDQELPIWIGLHKEGASWKWSWKDSEYRNWLTGELNNNGNCGSISSLTKRMTAQNCGAFLPFLCMSDSVVLVKENKSWEEALEHCRGLYSLTNTKLRYDFLSLQPEDQHDLVRRKVMQAYTNEVWTGLRFLAGDWLWVNGADMLYTNLPLCPTLGQHCGILSKNSTGTMEARDCLERKNFLCYSYF